MKRCVADTKVTPIATPLQGGRPERSGLLFLKLLIGYLCAWSRFEGSSPETTDLLEGCFVTEKPTTPEDTREHHTQHNRQNTTLHSHRPLASG